MRANKAAWLAIPILVLCAAIPAAAQAPPGPDPAPGSNEAGNDNSHGVARVSFIHGDVTMQRGDSGDFSSVALNTPLMTGDKVATGEASRTELQLDYANILRLDQNAQATIATLENNRIQVQVSQGLAFYSVLKGSQADAEIDTPNVSIHPTRDGRYRVQVNSDGDSFVTVNDGEAQVSTPEGSTTVKRGQLITVRGTAGEVQYRVSEAPNVDDWDKWNRDRDNTIYNANAYRRTNRYYTGAGDLDAYGTWSEVPDYGPVWIPRVNYGWAPYRAGRWVWEPYWGWTWVSYEPWGWAPYHYGRWFLWGGAWAWWPGPVFPAYRPIWAPAYVSFFGFGGGVGFGVGFGFGSVGWLPIGPCDFFHPWWGGFRDRFGVVNVTNINVTNINIRNGIAPLHGGNRFSNVNEILVNDRLRQGVSGVPAESFGRGRVAPRTVAAADVRGGRLMTGNLPVVPTHDSLRTSERPVNAAITARMSAQHSFFSSRAAASARPESFSSQAARVNESIQRSGQFRPVNGGSAVSANPGAVRPAFGEQSNARQPGVAPRVNSVGGARNPVQPEIRGGRTLPTQGQRPQVEQGVNGWQRFGNERGATNQAPSATAPAQIRPNVQPELRGNVPVGREAPNANAGGSPNRSNQRASEGWQSFSRSNGAVAPSNGVSAPASSGGRPTLDMNKPIVNERSYRGNADSYAGTNRGSSAPAYRPAPSYSQPSYRSSPPAPSYSAPRSSGPAPSYRSYPANPAPVYRSAPAPRSESSGGGYSGAASRGGGGYSGGGASRGGGSRGGSSGGRSGGSSRGR
jgi:FecR protein